MLQLREMEDAETSLQHYLTQDTGHLEEFLSKFFQRGRFVEKLVTLVNTRLPVTIPYDVNSEYMPLGYAIVQNDPESVDLLLRYGACPHTAPCASADNAVSVQSPLHLALLRHSVPAIVDSLLKYGASSAQIQSVSSLLHFIVKCLSKATAAALMSYMSSFDRTDSDGRTLLHLAAMNGNDAVARRALRTHEVDVDKVDTLGKTALMYAAKRNSSVCVQLLLHGGATVDMTDAWGRTALHFAVRRADLKIVELLLSSGADIETEDNKGLTPLNYAFSSDDILHRREPKENSEDLLQSMLNSTKKRVSLYKRDFVNVAYPMARTCETESVIIKLLEDNSSHLSQRNDDGQMLIHVAAEFNKHRVVKWLIEKTGLNPNISDAVGWQPLHYAAKGGNRETFVYLLKQHGADVNSATPSGWTPMWILTRNGWTDLACDVMHYGCDVMRYGCYVQGMLTVSALRQADSHFSLPLSLFDPEEQNTKPVEYAQCGSRRIGLIEFASECGFTELTDAIAIANKKREAYDENSKKTTGDDLPSNILVTTRTSIANMLCQSLKAGVLSRTVHANAFT